MTAEKRIYLVDAHAYLHRAYHALPPNMRSSSGEPTWALYGFAATLLSLVRDEKPGHMVVCFDLPQPTFRHEKFKDYKATRKALDEDLIFQLDKAEEMVRCMGIPTVSKAGYEADDVIATLARKAVAAGLDVVIVSGDKDVLQLVDERVKVLVKRNQEDTVYDSKKVFEKLKVRPDQVVDFLSIIGDSSDNIPGVTGIGRVGAADLLGRYESLEGAIAEAYRVKKAMESGEKKKFDIKPKAVAGLTDYVQESEKRKFDSRDLVRLDDKVPIELELTDAAAKVEPSAELVELFSRYGFKSLLRRLGAAPIETAAATKTSEASPPPSVTFARLEVALRPISPREMIIAAQQAPMVAVAVAEAVQPDLLTSTHPQIALALPDGRAAAFLDKDFDAHRAALAKVLGSSSVEIVGHDLKAALRILREIGFELCSPVADTMLAAYCLNPSLPGYSLAEVLREYAGVELPEEPRPAAHARRAAAVWTLQKVFAGELRSKNLLTLYEKFEIPLLRVLADMETEGVAIDRPYLKRLSREFESEIGKIKLEVDALGGAEINLGSPKQLVELFIGKLKLPVIHKTKKGGISTDDTALRAWAELHPIARKIIEYRERTKLKSTYIEALLEKAADKTGRVHSHFNQAGTATGRISSLDPNLQNIPVRTALGRRIRKAFIAGKGNVLIAADYSQIDLRVLAHLSGDKALCEAFRKGEDIHTKTAAEVFEIAPEDLDPEMRRRAKAVNFGIVYGQSAHGLSQELGIPHGKAKQYIEGYFAHYEGVEKWLKENIAGARKNGCVETLLGRVRTLPDINSKNFNLRAFNERVAGNTPIQGTSADIIKVAMINIHSKMAESGQWKARLILQVHDELIFEAPARECEAFSAWVRTEMENAIQLKVPVLVSVKTGPNWNDMKAAGS